MNVVLPRRAMDEVSKSSNPFAEILKKVGDLTDIIVMYNMVLMASYIKPEKTAGGIIRPGQSLEEDIYQGKTGMVLKLGREAFQDDGDTQFHGQKAEIGEWVVFKLGDAWKVQVREWPCLLVRDSAIKMKVTDPSIIDRG
jgi:co-chaperonin GroES (HSP10)